MAGINIVFQRVAVAANTIKSGAGLWLRGVARAVNSAARLVDFSGNSNDGTLNTGKFATFNGSTSDITHSGTISGIKTAQVWVNPDTTTETLFDFDGGTTSIRIAAGVVTANNITNARIYVDDTETTTAVASQWQLITITTHTAFDATTFRFSATSLGGDAAYIRLYSDALTPEQVEELFDYPERIIPNGMPWRSLLTFLPLCDGNSIGGSVADMSYFGRVFTLANVTFDEGAAEPAPQFAVQNNQERAYSCYVDITDAPELDFTSSDDWSLACKFWVRSNTGSQGLIVKDALNSAYSLSIQSGLLKFRGAASTPELSYAISNNTPYTVVCTVSGGTTAVMYVNGTSVASGTIAAAAATANNLQLAGYSSGNELQGMMYYGALYDKTLTQYQAQDFADGLLPNEIDGGRLRGYWTNDGLTTWYDRSRYGNDGTVNGSPSAMQDIEGRFGLSGHRLPFLEHRKNRLLFRSSGYASVADDNTLDATSGLTVEAWVRLSSVGATQQILLKTSAYGLKIQSDNTVRFSIWQTSEKTLDSTATLSADTWYHLCGTHDGTDTVLYINGSQEATSAANSGNVDSNANNVLIGAASTTPTNLLDGDLNNVRVYTSSATALEVVRNYRKQEKLFSYE